MTTVTGYTAAKMDEIANATITGAHLTGDNLILEKKDGGTIDVGSVRGSPGPTGASPVVVTSTTRPTTSLFQGLVIYETDTGQSYIYTGSDWLSYEPMRVCTSTSHPVGPFVGMQIYETDTHKMLIWNGVRFDKPWNLGWGPIAGAGVFGSYSDTEVPLSFTPGPVTFVNPGHRNYRIKLNLGVYRALNQGYHLFQIKRNGTTIRTMQPSNPQNPANDDRFTLNDEYNEAPPAGVITYTVTARGEFPPSSGTYDLDVAIQNCTLTVEDIGPWGNPV